MTSIRIDDPDANVGVQAAMIAEQNDAFRKAMCRHENPGIIPQGKIVMTQGVNAKGPAFHMVLMQRLAEYNNFTADNDPNGWHDFGSIKVNGIDVWFKIDLYDENYDMGSETPHDIAVTRRVMTLLFPSEY